MCTVLLSKNAININTIVFNSMRIPGKDYQMKVKKITEYEEGKYKLTVEAYLTNVGSSVK